MLPLGYRAESPLGGVFVDKGYAVGSCCGWPFAAKSSERVHAEFLGNPAKGVMLLLPGYTLPFRESDGKTSQIVDDHGRRWHGKACLPHTFVRGMSSSPSMGVFAKCAGSALPGDYPLVGLEHFQDCPKYRSKVMDCTPIGPSPFSAPFDRNRYIYDYGSEFRGTPVGGLVDVYEEVPGISFRMAFDNRIRIFCNRFEYDPLHPSLSRHLGKRPWGFLASRRGVKAHTVLEVTISSRMLKKPEMFVTGALEDGVPLPLSDVFKISEALDTCTLPVISLGHALENDDPWDAQSACTRKSVFWKSRMVMKFRFVFESGGWETGYSFPFRRSQSGMGDALPPKCLNEYDIVSTFSDKLMRNRSIVWKTTRG